MLCGALSRWSSRQDPHVFLTASHPGVSDSGSDGDTDADTQSQSQQPDGQWRPQFIPGAIWDLTVKHPYEGQARHFDDIVAVGAFDTATDGGSGDGKGGGNGSSSRATPASAHPPQYCNVGVWDNTNFDKVRCSTVLIANVCCVESYSCVLPLCCRLCACHCTQLQQGLCQRADADFPGELWAAVVGGRKNSECYTAHF